MNSIPSFYIVELILVSLVSMCGWIYGDSESEVDLSQHFDLPICCYGGPTHTTVLPIIDSHTAYTSVQHNKYQSEPESEARIGNESNTSKPKEISLRIYKITHPLNSTVDNKKAKRSPESQTNQTDQTFNTFDKVKELEGDGDETSAGGIPVNWEQQLRKALFHGMSPSQSQSRNEDGPKSKSSDLWDSVKDAPLQVIDASTRTLSTLHTQPDLSRNFSGVMVNTKSGVEIRTTASSSNLIGSDQSSCDCPLIQRGDMPLAYWSVNTQSTDDGQNVVEYEVYPLPHNVPTPPLFIPFTPDLYFRPSPVDLNSDHEEVETQRIPFRPPPIQRSFHPQSPHPIPHPHTFHPQPPLPPPYPIPNPSLLEIERNILAETQPGYSHQFLEWYRSVLDNHFRFPRGHDESPFGPLPTYLLPEHFHQFPPSGPHIEQLPPQHVPLPPPNTLPPPYTLSPQEQGGIGIQEPGPPPPYPGNNILRPEETEMNLGGGVEGGSEFPSPLPHPILPSLNHPKSIQEIISFKIPDRGPGRLVREHPGTKCEVHTSQNEIECKEGNLPPLPHVSSKDEGFRKKSLSFSDQLTLIKTKKPSEVEGKDDPSFQSKSRESGYILNF